MIPNFYASQYKIAEVKPTEEETRLGSITSSTKLEGTPVTLASSIRLWHPNSLTSDNYN